MTYLFNTFDGTVPKEFLGTFFQFTPSIQKMYCYQVSNVLQGIMTKKNYRVQAKVLDIRD